MLDADLPDPQTVLDRVLKATGAELLVVSHDARVLAGSDGLAGLLGIKADLLARGARMPDFAAVSDGRAERRELPLPGRRIAYLFRRPPAAAPTRRRTTRPGPHFIGERAEDLRAALAILTEHAESCRADKAERARVHQAVTGLQALADLLEEKATSAR